MRLAQHGGKRMADVFLSYAREDRSRAEQIARALSAMGLECFWDTEIPPGQTWSDYIERKLDQSRVVVVLWSQHSTKSQWVREEARMGRDKAKLIPAIIDGSSSPLGFGEVQAADLTGWQGQTTHPQWTRFANAVFTAARGSAPPQHQTATQPPPSAWRAAPSTEAQGEAESLSPIGYVQKCLRLYFSGKGRARRAEYGWFILFQFIVALIAIMLDIAMYGFNPYTSAPNGYAFTWLLLAFLPPSVSAASRRAHDFGQSGWLAVLTVIPYIGWIAILVFIFLKGQPASNPHGPSPKAALAAV
jgi:uncharacterized membrane protein YhaH (DUF805 family)